MIEDEACIGLHIHNKGLATSNAVPGSMWEWALNKYRPQLFSDSRSPNPVFSYSGNLMLIITIDLHINLLWY